MTKGQYVYSWLSFSDSAGSMVITALASWLAWAAVCPAVWVRREGPWLHHFTFFLLPPTCDSEGSRSSVQLHPLASNAVNHLVPSLYSCFTVCWATVWLLNYCIWNQLPNRAAKNTPSNQIMVMWVDELFLYTVLVPNKSLNPFRTWKRKVKQEYHQQYLVLC